MNMEFLKYLNPVHLKNEVLERLITPEVEAVPSRTPKPVGRFGHRSWGCNTNLARSGLRRPHPLFQENLSASPRTAWKIFPRPAAY